MSADLTPRDDRRRRQVLTALAALAVVAAVAALAVRIRLGIDLRDESFYVASPLRWVFGDRPLIDEMSLLQLAGLLVYPAAKAFVWLTGGTHGYVLYMRVVYLAFCVLVSVCVALALGRLVRRQYAVMIALVYVTYVIITYTQVSYDTLGAGFLTIGVALGVPIVCGRAAPTGRRRLLALGAGLAHGLACVAYPTMVVLVPVYAAALALALNDGVTDGLARLVVPPADRDAAVEHQSRDGVAGWRRRAWLAVSAYLAGALVVGLALAAVLLHAGRQNVVRDARGQLAGTKTVDQLGGLAKVHEIAWSVGRLLWWHPWFLLAFALLALLLYYRPRLARTLLLLTPLALFFAGQRAILYASGFAIVYALLVPYLYVFVQPGRRAAAARLLVWGGLTSFAAGFLTAYTSAAGFVNAAVGLLPAFMVTGVFLVWSAGPEAPERGGWDRQRWWLVAASLLGVLAVTAVFAFQFLPRAVPLSQMTATMTNGPYAGIRTTPGRRALLDGFARDLARLTRPGDRLMIFYEAPGLYLYWRGPIAANTVWIWRPPSESDHLPVETLDWFRREGTVPDVVVRPLATAGLSDAQLAGSYLGGLRHYHVVLRRPQYAILRRDGGVSDAQVIADLPR